MLALVLYVLWCITPGESLSYPVFGTKRYHRASGSSFIPSSSSSSSYPSTPYVMPQYYDQEQQPFISTNYDHNGYVNGNGYYYYPRHAYHSYGLPTYRGEYKPTPYYYAPGPSYSYYDDRDIAPNPLDDLHEEILQEDERERQREMIPVGQENWYDNSRHQDDLTNNFLRNLIAYNRELDSQQLQQQQQQQQQQQEKQQQEKQKQQQLQQQKQHQQQVLQQQHLVYREQPEEYDDYSEPNSDYEYDQQDERLYDLKKNENQQHQHNSYNEMEDEDERQLKSLARANEDQSNKNHVEGNIQENNYNNWQHSPSAYAQYDTDPEYDDAWTTWDRKRSRSSKVSSKRDESIKDFNDRKTFPFVKYLGTMESTKTPIISASAQPFESSATTLRSKIAEISGQKEIVLPRPSTPVQHMFAQPVLDIIGSALKTHIVQGDEEKRSNDDNKASNVYDTIKELITMQEHLEKSYENSKFQKRFVSSEESLVHELNSLKRQSQ